MINKKCPKCGKKIKRSYDFCPYCGYDIKKEKDQKDYGFLGKDDFFTSEPKFGMGLPGGLGKIFNNLMSQIEREFQNMDRKIGQERKSKKKPKSRGISINISTGTGKKPEIKVRGYGPGFKKKKVKKKSKEKKKIEKPKISKKKAKKIAKLPREEAETEVRRLSDKIIYEIKLPGVKSIENIGINKLENSIEIKAVGEDKVYFKLLPVSLPIKNYKLKNGKLILELKQK